MVEQTGSLRRNGRMRNMRKRILIDASLLKHLYVDKRLSTREIAKRLGVSQGTIQRRLKRLGVARNLGEGQHAVKSRHLREFDGDPLTRAELLALRFTDFSSIKHRRRILFTTSTTHAGMIKFAYEVCGPHADIRCTPVRRKRKIDPNVRCNKWEWGIRCSFDDSYDFLLIPKGAVDFSREFSWMDDEEEQLFLTRAIECDGWISIIVDRYCNKFKFRMGFYNSNLNLANFIRRLIERHCRTKTRIHGIRTLNENIVYNITCDVKRRDLKFIEKLQWRHPEKIWRLELALELCDEKITQEGLDKIKEIRGKILELRDKTIELAKMVFASRPKGRRPIPIEELIRLLGI